MPACDTTTTAVLTPCIPPGMVARDWTELSRVLDGFAHGARMAPKMFRTEAVTFRGNLYTIEYLPAGHARPATPEAARTMPGGDYAAVRVSVRTADCFSCGPAKDFWPRFIGTLSRLLERITGRLDSARREAIGWKGLFESCEHGCERYLRLALSTEVAMREPAGDIEAVFSDKGAKQDASHGRRRSVVAGRSGLCGA